jgi:D-xylose reductase
MAQEEGIAVTGHSTFGPQSFMELPPSFRARAENVPMLFDNPVIRKIAEAHGVSPGQVLLRWATRR